MQNFGAVIFDMDGLLLDTERLALAAFQSACSMFNLGDLSDIYFRCIGMNSKLGTSVLREGLDGVVDFEEFNLAWLDGYRRSIENRPIPLKNGVEEVLRHVEALDVPMAVATSSSSERAKLKLQKCGIDHYFTHLVGGDQVTRSKPDPEIYLQAAAVLSCSPGKCLAFEDSTNGVKAAVAAGMTVVQIPDLVYPDEELLGLGHIVLDSLMDILNYDFSC